MLVLHALTGDSHAAGPAGPGHPTPGWWDGLIGPGRALDTDRWFVVAPNVLGGCQGSTGPASPRPGTRRCWGGAFPYLTVRDQVAAEVRLADALGIGKWALVAGGSMGGMRAVEWAVSYPERTDALLLLATTAAASAEQIAWATLQLHAVRGDPHWRSGDYHDTGRGPHAGLGLARRIAHVTYRSEPELSARFGRAPQGAEDPWRGGRYQVESYLDHHAAKLVRRFDAGSYVVLTEAMNGHDVGRGRGGVRAALRRVTARTLVAGVGSDRLYPPGPAGRTGRAHPRRGPAPGPGVAVRTRRLPHRDGAGRRPGARGAAVGGPGAAHRSRAASAPPRRGRPGRGRGARSGRRGGPRLRCRVPVCCPGVRSARGRCQCRVAF